VHRALIKDDRNVSILARTFPVVVPFLRDDDGAATELRTIYAGM
jgi:hypothetical protein